MDVERDEDNATPQATPPTWPLTFDPTPPNAASENEATAPTTATNPAVGPSVASATSATNETASTEQQPATEAAPVAPEPGPPAGAEFVPPSTWGWTGPRVEDSGPPPMWPAAPPARGDDG